MVFTNACLPVAGGVAAGDPEARPGDPGPLGQDEDPGGAALGLPAPHHRLEGVALRQGGALQHAPG